MKRQLRRMVLLLAGVFLLLTGCSGSGPVCATAEQGDFRVTFTSAQSVYDSADLDPDKPLHFETRVDYLGGEIGVWISHGAWLGRVELYTAEGERIIDRYDGFVGTPSYLTQDYLRWSGAVIEKSYGRTEYHLVGPLDPGKYVAKVQVEFSYAQSQDERGESLAFDLEVPFTIK